MVNKLMGQGLIHENALTVNGQTIGENCKDDEAHRRTSRHPPLRPAAARRMPASSVLRGNLFDSAIMKTSVISEEFRERYLSNPNDPEAFEGPAVVFDGPEDYHRRIDDPALGIDEHTMLFMRGAGPIGYPGAAEVVNMRPPAYLLTSRHQRPALHRRRPPVRHLGLALDPQRLAGSGGRRRAGAAQDRRPRPHRPEEGHRPTCCCPDEELAERRKALEAAGGYKYPASQTPWQEIQRDHVGQMGTGMVLENAVKYQRIAQTMGIPRDNH